MEIEEIKKMYVEDLRALAKSRGVPGSSKMKKTELIAALEENEKSQGSDRRRFNPGSDPVTDGRPSAYPPEPDPQDGESDPPAAENTPAENEKNGEPLPAHQSNRDKIRQIENLIREDLSEQEISALAVLAEHGWLMLTNPRIENAASRTAARSYKAKGRYRMGCVKNRIMR